MDALILLSFTLSVLLGIARTADLLLGTDPVSGLCVVGPVWVRYAALGAAVLAAVLVGRHCAGNAKNLQQPKKSAGVLSALAGVLLVVTAGLRLYFAQFMGVTWGIRAVLELLCAVWMLVLARSWLSKTGWTAPKGGLPLAVLGSVLFYWNVLMRFMENSSSWHRQNAARPDAHSALPLPGSGRYSARASADRNSRAASICQTADVGAARCQLELFSIKRISTFQ